MLNLKNLTKMSGKKWFYRVDYDHEVQPLLAYKEYQTCESVKKKTKKILVPFV